MQGRTGRFFSSYGITVAFAILVSMFISFTLTPMLGSRFLKPSADPDLREKRAHGGGLMRWIARHYDRLLAWSLKHRPMVMLGAGAVVSSLFVLLPMTQFNYMPQDDSSEFEVAVEAPEGSSLARTESLLREIEQKLKAVEIDGMKAVTDTLVTVGDLSTSIGKGKGKRHAGVDLLPSAGTWRILRDTPRPHPSLVRRPMPMGRARRVLSEYPRPSVECASASAGSAVAAAAIPSSILISSDPTWPNWASFPMLFLVRLRQVPGLVDVDTTLSNRKPELQVRIDRDKANQFGISIEQIARALRTAVGGEIVSTGRKRTTNSMSGSRRTAAIAILWRRLSRSSSAAARRRRQAPRQVRNYSCPWSILFRSSKPAGLRRLTAISASAG
jgi:HAE1 family hydrophobic/amphiphilic exporter-1